MHGEWMSSCVPYRTEEAGGQREDNGRRSRWGGRGGGGDVCQEGWLGSTSEETEGRKRVSQAFLISVYQFISLCLFPVFTPHLDSFYLFFSFHCWIPHTDSLSPSCPGAICPLTLFLLFLSWFCISPQHLLSTFSSLCVF